MLNFKKVKKGACMFTGIVECTAEVRKVQNKGEGKEITLGCPKDFLKAVKIGDSIAVNGACQTVTSFNADSFVFFSSLQTLELTNLGALKTGSVVNLEKALLLNQRLDGHIVSGHIDGTGVVNEVKKQQEGYLFSFTVPEHLLETLVKKGSIAVDGISLTLYDLQDKLATISVIPLTYQETTLSHRKKGDLINLESDVLGKYVVNFLKQQNNKSNSEDNQSGLSLSFLSENGFI